MAEIDISEFTYHNYIIYVIDMNTEFDNCFIVEQLIGNNEVRR